VGFMGRAGPVFPAVVWVSIISIRFVSTVQIRVGVGTGSFGGSSGWILTVIVTFVTYWPLSTVCVFFVITSHVDQIKHLRFACVRVVRTHVVISGAILEAMPVFPAVVRIWKISLS